MKHNIVVNYLGRTGSGPIIALNMAKGLLECGNNVYVIISKDIENADDWERVPFTKIFYVKTYHNYLSFLIGTLRFWTIDYNKLKTEFSNIDIDTCYIPMIQPWSEFINCLFPKAKKVVTLHDPIPHEGNGAIFNYLYKRVTVAANEIIILSETFLDETSKRYGISKEHIHVIPHGLLDYSEKKGNKVVNRTEIYNFLFFGRITKYKGLSLLSEAYHRLFMERQDISLYVVGSGDFSDYSTLFLESEKITVVNQYIPDEDVVSYFSGKNIITVLPYIDATQSGVVPIAMMENSLLIVTNTGGLREQTGNGKYAVLTEPTADSLYEAMKKVTSHYEDYQATIHKAHEYIRSLSWDKLAKCLNDIL